MDWASIFSAPIGFWHWWIAAAILGALEMTLPGVVFLWLALAAVANGLLVFAAAELFQWDPGWEVQMLTFSVLGLLSMAGGRRLWRNRRLGAARTLNRRTADLIGRTCSLEGPLENGRGWVRLGDTLWLVSGRDLPAGTRVRITGADGATLVVEALETRGGHAGFTES